MNLDNLTDVMKDGVAEFSFMKQDGSTRKAYGTLNSNFIATSKIPSNGIAISGAHSKVLGFFDVEAMEWRSMTKSINQSFNGVKLFKNLPINVNV